MHDYNQIVASHYAAYRPPLHGRILDEALGASAFSRGLDIGCGAGQSAVALAGRCASVIGLDASEEMIAAAEPHPKISYEVVKGGAYPVEDRSVNIVTLAGVLPYLDASRLVEELRRMLRPAGVVFVYDFRIDLTPLLAALDLSPGEGDRGYDHSRNLSDQPGVTDEGIRTYEAELTVTLPEAVHLALSSDRRLTPFAARFGVVNPVREVEKALAARLKTRTLTARIWFAIHRVET